MLEHGWVFEETAELSSVACIDGLSSKELNVLLVAASSIAHDDDATSPWSVRNDCERAGLDSLSPDALNLDRRSRLSCFPALRCDVRLRSHNAR
jgi:hypothetical protein